MTDCLVLACGDVVSLDLVDLMMWAIERFRRCNEGFSEQAEQGSFGCFQDVHGISSVWGWLSEKVVDAAAGELDFVEQVGNVLAVLLELVGTH